MLTELDLISTEYICLNMREADRRELLAQRAHDSAIHFAWEAYHGIKANGRGRIAWHKSKPAALAALTEIWPGRFQVWMFGTDDFKAAAIPLLRWFRKEAADILTVVKANRLDCDSIADHHEAHAMIEAMGGVKDGPVMRRYGKNGEDFQRYVWLNGENDAVIKPGYVRAA